MLFLTLITTLQTASAEDTYITDAPEGYRQPSPLAQKNGSMYITSGILKQVQDNYHVTSGKSVDLSADAARSQMDLKYGRNKPLQYRWLAASDKEAWHYLDGDSKRLTFTPPHNGNYWFQLEISYPMWGFAGFLNGGKPVTQYLYSNVAKVNVANEPKKADSLTINTESDYLYNRPNFFNGDSTYAFAQVQPLDTTEQVHWSLDSKNNDLAQIDKDGKISANLVSEGPDKSGEIQVLGTINQDLPGAEPINITKKIRVGGGLPDVHVSEDQEALFQIQGFKDASNTDNKKIKVTWESKSNVNGEFQNVSAKNVSSNKFIFQIPEISTQNNGNVYRARITASVDFKSYEYITNEATLLVSPVAERNPNFTATIENTTFTSHEDTDLALHNVVANDEISYNFKITNHSKEPIQSSEITTFLYKNTEITNISPGITPDLQSDEILQKVTIPTGTLSVGDSKTIELKTKIPLINERQSLTFQPVFTSHYLTKDSHIANGPEMKLNYLTNRVELYPNNIQFEPIRAYESNLLKPRLNPTTAPITIDDQRRDKSKSVTLMLQQKTDFKSADSHILPVSLFFHESPDNIKNVKDPTPITKSEPNRPLESFHWDSNNGLFLHLDSLKDLVAGDYQASLSWGIQDSV